MSLDCMYAPLDPLFIIKPKIICRFHRIHSILCLYGIMCVKKKKSLQLLKYPLIYFLLSSVNLKNSSSNVENNREVFSKYVVQ